MILEDHMYDVPSIESTLVPLVVILLVELERLRRRIEDIERQRKGR